jgi:hypothetical protein
LAREQAEAAAQAAAKSGANPDVLARFWYGVLPNMAMGGPNPNGYVDEEQLKAILTLLSELQERTTVREDSRE